MAYATTDDVVVSLGRSLTPDEETQSEALLERAELIIKRRVTTLAARIAEDADLQSVVVMVESDAVARVLRNPGGVYQESIDDYTYTRDRSVSAGTLYISEAEWDLLLTSTDTTGQSDAFSVRPYGEAGYADSVDDDGTWTSPTEFLP